MSDGGQCYRDKLRQERRVGTIRREICNENRVARDGLAGKVII